MKDMFLITSSWKDGQTFKMIPATVDCPYVECIYDPSLKILAVISKDKKNTFHMMPRLNDAGDPEMRKSPSKDGKPFKEERKTIETYQEYYIEAESEIKNFVDLFALNANSFDYAKYFNVQVDATPVLNIAE